MLETQKKKYMVPPALNRTALSDHTLLERLEILLVIIPSYRVSFFFIQQVNSISMWPSQRSGTQCFYYLLVIY